MMVRPHRSRGFTMVEVMGGLGFLSVGLVALAGSLISMSHQREQSVARSLVVASAQALVEEIKSSTNPRDISVIFQNATYKVKGVTGADGGDTLRISVDNTNPKLLTVRVTGTWRAAGHVETMQLVTHVYTYSGQKS